MRTRITKTDLSRSLLYSATIVLGTYTAFTELDQAKPDNFWRFILLCIILLFIELFTGIYYRRHLVQTRLPETDEQLRFVQVTYHFVLPLTMYATVLAFTYFEPRNELRIGIFLALFAALTVLFINIRAYYMHRRKLESQTHEIYDILKFIIIFCGAGALSSFARSGQSYLLSGIIMLILYLVLLLLFIIREHNFGLRELELAVGFSVVLTLLLGWLGANYTFSSAILGFVGALGFYLSSATLHHLLKRNLSRSIVSEYLLIAVMTLIMLFGLYVPAA